MNEVNWVKFFNILKVENPREYYTLLSELVKEEKVVATKQPTISEPLSISMPFKKEQRLR